MSGAFDVMAIIIVFLMVAAGSVLITVSTIKTCPENDCACREQDTSSLTLGIVLVVLSFFAILFSIGSVKYKYQFGSLFGSGSGSSLISPRRFL